MICDIFCELMGVVVARVLHALGCFYGSETMRDEEKDQGRQGLARRSGQADTRCLGCYACVA